MINPLADSLRTIDMPDFSKSYNYTPTTWSTFPLLRFPLSLAPVMDAKTDAKAVTPYFIHSKKLQKSRLFLRTSGFLGTPDVLQTHSLRRRIGLLQLLFH